MNIGTRFVSAGGAFAMAVGVMAAPVVLGTVASAHAAGCTNSGGTVMKPNPFRAYGVGNGSCGDIGTCVTTALHRGNRVLATNRQCGFGNVEVATEWVITNPIENLWADVQVVPNG